MVLSLCIPAFKSVVPLIAVSTVSISKISNISVIEKIDVKEVCQVMGFQMVLIDRDNKNWGKLPQYISLQ